MLIERSVDYVTIRELLTDARAYQRMKNDDAPMLCNFPYELPGAIEYVVAKDDAGAAAVFLLDWQAFEYAEIHFCFHPRKWGSTVAIAREFLSWMWQHTPMMFAIGPVPGYNSLARHLAEEVGFKEFDRRKRAVRKDGQLHDLILMRIERPAA